MVRAKRLTKKDVEQAIIVKQVPYFRCFRCSYMWLANLEHPPMYCANKACNSPYWFLPVKLVGTSAAHKKRGNKT